MLGLISFVVDFGMVVSLITLNLSNIIDLLGALGKRGNAVFISKEVFFGGLALFAITSIVKIVFAGKYL